MEITERTKRVLFSFLKQQTMGNSWSEGSAQQEEDGFLFWRKGEIKAVRRKLKYAINRCKNAYKERLEKHLEKNKAWELWRGLNKIAGNSKSVEQVVTMEDQAWANQLYQLVNRFDSPLLTPQLNANNHQLPLWTSPNLMSGTPQVRVFSILDYLGPSEEGAK